MSKPDFIDPVENAGLTAQWVYANQNTVDWLLSINTRNRKKKEFQIKTMINRMTVREWREVGDAIAVSVSGFLVNGQNRLEAIKRAGYPRVPFLLVTGLPDNSLGATDTGSPRTTMDVVKLLLNKSISGKVVAALKWLHLIKSRQVYSDNQQKISVEMLADWVDEYQDILVEFAGVIKTQRNTVSAPILEYAFRNKNKALAFSDQLITGLNLSIDDPAYLLREYLIGERGKGGAFVQRATYEQTVAAILKHVAGEKCKGKKLIYPATGWDGFDKR